MVNWLGFNQLTIFYVFYVRLTAHIFLLKFK
jgi:hypothetical protein